MRAISSIIDRAILIFSTALLIAGETKITMGVVCALIAVTVSFCMEYFENDKLNILLCVATALTATFIPEVVYLFPILAYDAVKSQGIWLLGGVFILPIIINIAELNGIVIALCLVICCIAVVLRNRTDKETELLNKYVKQRDDFAEASLRQQKAVDELLREQDNEVKVAILDERNRIAREIHDNVGHLLSSSILQLGAVLTITKDERIKEPLIFLKETLSEGMNSIRNSVHDLRNESIDLAEQLNRVISSCTGFEVRLEYDISDRAHARLKYAVIAIVKEALANVTKHSDAKAVRIMVFEHPRIIQLIISDNGTRIKESFENSAGMGIENIRQRVKSLNGSLNIKTGNGFSIFVSFPKIDEMNGGKECE